MAAKTRMGVGAGVTITLLAIASLGFFITTVVFWSKHQSAEQRKAESDTRLKEVLDDGTATQVRALNELARTNRQSLVGFMLSQQRDLMQEIAGDPSMTLEQLRTNLTALAEREGTVAGLEPSETVGPKDVLAALDHRIAAIASLKRELRDAEAVRDEAERLRDESISRVDQIEASFDATTTGLEATVDDYAAQVEAYQGEVTRVRDNATSEINRLTADHRAERLRLDEDLRDLRDQVAIKDETIASLQAELRGKKFTGANEATLVDGRILSVGPGGNIVYINRGVRDKVVVGLTFEVYPDAGSVRPNAEGVYPPGKATIEVISVDGSSAACRVLTSRRGNPIAQDDVIVNAVYDPDKVYRFVVFGVFDANRDGVADVLETEGIEALIQAWGGRVEREFSGDIDFLVLGQRPAIPPEPGPNAPFSLVQEYLAKLKLAQRYDELFAEAVATGIPVLNENRLYTLTGKRFGL